MCDLQALRAATATNGAIALLLLPADREQHGQAQVLPYNSPTEAPLLWPPLLATKGRAPTVIRQTVDNCGTVRCLVKWTRAVELTGLSVQ
jgi:hypothetical protein